MTEDEKRAAAAERQRLSRARRKMTSPEVRAEEAVAAERSEAWTEKVLDRTSEEGRKLAFTMVETELRHLVERVEFAFSKGGASEATRTWVRGQVSLSWDRCIRKLLPRHEWPDRIVRQEGAWEEAGKDPDAPDTQRQVVGAAWPSGGGPA